MDTKTIILNKVNQYTEKGYLYETEWNEITEKADNLNKTLLNGSRLNIDQIIRNKFKIRNRESENINTILKNEGFIKKNTLIKTHLPEEKTHKRLMNGSLFVIENKIIFENELEQHKIATYYNEKSTLNKKKVLLKLLKQEHTEDHKKIVDFYAGYEKVKKIDHPNVMSGVDKWIDKAGLYYAIEYLEGETLSYAIKNKTINTKEAIEKIINGIINGLSYLHKNKIYLGDLNPNKILITKDKNAIIANLELFGSHCPIKKLEKPINPQEYIAPEQEKNGKSEKADIFSLGKIITYITTGQTQDLLKIKNSLSPDLQAVAVKATNPKQSLRYNNAKEIIKSRRKFNFKNSTKGIAENINYIYVILSGILMLALSNKIIALLKTDYVLTKQVITVLGIFAIIFPAMIIVFNLVLKDDDEKKS